MIYRVLHNIIGGVIMTERIIQFGEGGFLLLQNGQNIVAHVALPRRCSIAFIIGFIVPKLPKFCKIKPNKLQDKFQKLPSPMGNDSFFLLQRFDLFFRQIPPFSHRQFSQGDAAFPDPAKTGTGHACSFAHPADLPVSAFMNGD